MKKILLLALCAFYTLVSWSQQNWSSAGNSGINPGTEFLGTTDNVPLIFRVNNVMSGRIASNGFVSLGYEANAGATHYSNTAIGHQTFKNITTPNANWSTAVGWQAGYSVTTADNSTFVGFRAGYGTTTGTTNTGIGCYSLGSELGGPLTGTHNTALGGSSLRYLTTGSRNIGIGINAGIDNTYYTLPNQNSKIDNDCIFLGSFSSRDQSIPNTTALQNAIAIGSYSKVAASNSLILGGTGSYAVNVGIGNIAPQNKLEITHGTNGNSGLRFTNLTSASTAGSSSGKVLSVNANGDVVLEQAASGGGGTTYIQAGTNVTVGGTGTNSDPYVISATGGTSHWDVSSIGTGNIINSNTGGVIIGTGVTSLPSGYKLYVADGILAEKVKVALKSGSNWADYVFSKDYQLKPLSEVEAYIRSNQHLPGMPSAESLVKEGGIDVNQMFAKQMEKIEELTLYIIEMNRKLEKLQKENEALKKTVSIVNQ